MGHLGLGNDACKTRTCQAETSYEYQYCQGLVLGRHDPFKRLPGNMSGLHVSGNLEVQPQGIGSGVPHRPQPYTSNNQAEELELLSKFMLQ